MGDRGGSVGRIQLDTESGDAGGRVGVFRGISVKESTLQAKQIFPRPPTAGSFKLLNAIRAGFAGWHLRMRPRAIPVRAKHALEQDEKYHPPIWVYAVEVVRVIPNARLCQEAV
jgi:hypothetical protein